MTKHVLAVRLATLLGVALALAALLVRGPGAPGWIAAFVCVVLVRLSYIDATTRLLPNRIVLPAAALVLALQIATSPGQYLTWLGATIGAAALLLIFALIHPAGLGLGDVKLMLLVGAALGGAVVGALFVGMALAAVSGMTLIARHGWAARRQTIALGPYLATGAVIMLILAPGR
jgi:leader peptidase (prepilin peptidase) / N-methyltransferase